MGYILKSMLATPALWCAKDLSCSPIQSTKSSSSYCILFRLSSGLFSFPLPCHLFSITSKASSNSKNEIFSLFLRAFVWCACTAHHPHLSFRNLNTNQCVYTRSTKRISIVARLMCGTFADTPSHQMPLW